MTNLVFIFVLNKLNESSRGVFGVSSKDKKQCSKMREYSSEKTQSSTKGFH